MLHDVMDVQTKNKAVLAPLRAAMVDFDADGIRTALRSALAPDAVIHMPHPFGDFEGPDAFYDACYAPLF